MQIFRGVYRKRSLGRNVRSFLVNYRVIIQVPSVRNVSVSFSRRMSANRLSLVPPPRCRSIENDWTNFLAFYLVVSILSSGISVPASHRGDRFLSRTEETRRLTRVRFLGHTSVRDPWIGVTTARPAAPRSFIRLRVLLLGLVHS